MFSLVFFVTPLESTCSAFLGLNWLTCYNPLVDWASRRLTFRSSVQVPPKLTPSPALFAASLPDPSVRTSTLQAPHIALVNASTFQRACSLPGSQAFQILLPSISLRSGSSSDAPDLSNVPPQYHDFADVFSKSKADSLPDHRPYDLKINLEEGTQPPLGPIYSLSPSELEAL